MREGRGGAWRGGRGLTGRGGAGPGGRGLTARDGMGWDWMWPGELDLPWGFSDRFRRQARTYFSNSLSVEAFRVSKSISISSGLEFLREGSLDCII